MNALEKMALTIGDLKKAYNNAYEAIETLDTIAVALNNDNTTNQLWVLLKEVELTAGVCKNYLDGLSTTIDDIE